MSDTYDITFTSDHFSITGEPCWWAHDPALPGATGYGSTRDEAAAMLAKSRAALLRHAAERGERPPRPVHGTDLVIYDTAPYTPGDPSPARLGEGAP